MDNYPSILGRSELGGGGHRCPCSFPTYLTGHFGVTSLVVPFGLSRQRLLRCQPGVRGQPGWAPLIGLPGVPQLACLQAVAMILLPSCVIDTFTVLSCDDQQLLRKPTHRCWQRAKEDDSNLLYSWFLDAPSSTLPGCAEITFLS